jgi:hypothetical protein
MSRFIDMLPTNKLRDERFMRMALAIECAIREFEDDGGEPAEVPMLCIIIVVCDAFKSENPRTLLEATYQLMMRPFEREQS